MAGIKLEAGFRFTNTDYLDDVSTRYFNPTDLDGMGTLLGPDALIYSKVNTGETYFIHVNYDGNPPPSSDYDINGIKSIKEASNDWVAR